jgi:hypothetical protein
MSRSLLAFAVALAVAGGAACGGNPSGPSGAVNLRGTVVGDVSASDRAGLSSEQAGARAGRITVTVKENGRLSTTVGGDGRFELDGVPEGSFTLAFTSDGKALGTIEITGASAGQEIRITVRLTGSRVALVAIEHANGGGDDGDADDDDGGAEGSRVCAISGGKVGEGIELEGNVASGDAAGFELRVNGNRVKNGATVRVTTAGASFKCNGKPTATECRSTVQSPAKVHVKGNLNACDLQSALVAASQVMVQKP